MALTDAKIRAAKPQDKPYKLAISGLLFLDLITTILNVKDKMSSPHHICGQHSENLACAP